MNNDQCSELFDKVFDSKCGGCVRTCECGITHFDGYNFQDQEWKDELKELQKKAKADPDHYIEHDCAIGTMAIDRIEIVYGCPCDLAKKYEAFILNHASQLAEYLNKRAVMLREKADLIEVKKIRRIKMNEVIPRTKRGAEWKEFADKVLTHIDTYTVPQYGDTGEDNVTKWNARDCMLAIKKYIARFGKNSRKGQDKLDMLKVAHYACLIYNKLEEGE